MKKTKILLLVMSLILISLMMSISAETKTLGTYKLGQCVNLIQVCASCSYVNISSIFSPSSQNLLAGGGAMNLSAGGVFIRNFCNTTKIGQYIVNGIGDLNGIPTIFSYNFYITQTQINDSGSVFSMIAIFIIWAFIMIIGFWKKIGVFLCIDAVLSLIYLALLDDLKEIIPIDVQAIFLSVWLAINLIIFVIGLFMAISRKM